MPPEKAVISLCPSFAERCYGTRPLVVQGGKGTIKKNGPNKLGPQY